LKLSLICYLCYKYQVENAVSHLLMFKKCLISRYNVTCWVCIWPFCILYLVFVTQVTDKWWFWLSVLAKLPMAVVKYNWFCQSASFGCNQTLQCYYVGPFTWYGYNYIHKYMSSFENNLKKFFFLAILNCVHHLFHLWCCSLHVCYIWILIHSLSVM
jgi:hypothetical protein